MSDSQDNNNNKKDYIKKQFQRNRYFYGKLLSVGDFEAEQGYMNDKRHLINRVLNGAGIVCGLYNKNNGNDNDKDKDVEVSSREGKLEITFKSGGIAIDCSGREIIVLANSTREVFVRTEEEGKLENLTTAGNQDKTFYLYLECHDRDYELVGSAGSGDTCSHSRIIEDFLVIASEKPPTIPTFLCTSDEEQYFPIIVCPDLSQLGQGDAKEKLKDWLKENTSAMCSGCGDSGVFILAVDIGDSGEEGFEINNPETVKYLSFIHNNKLQSELLACHLADFDNPHKSFRGLKVVKKDKEGKETDVDVVEHKDELVTIEKSGSITLAPDVKNNKITIGENHSIKEDDPHKSFKGLRVVNKTKQDETEVEDQFDIEHKYKVITIANAETIQFAYDEVSNKVTISETHSGLLDCNPHDTKHADLQEVLPFDSVEEGKEKEEDFIRNKHVSKDDGRRWDAAAADPGGIKTIAGLSNPGGNINIEAAEGSMITIGIEEGDDETDPSIIIGDTHSEITGNPHGTKHTDLGPVPGIKPEDETDQEVDKHVSNQDAKLWNKALVSVNGVGRDANGNVELIPDENSSIKIEKGENIGKPNSIIINETHSTTPDKNPHGTKHADLEEVLPFAPVDPEKEGDEDFIRNKHVSKDDARKWNEAADAASQEGGIVRIAELENPGGNINIEAAEGSMITIGIEEGDDETDPAIIIGETHSAITGNPHGTTAADVGALPASDGTVDGIVNFTGNVGIGTTKPEAKLEIVADSTWQTYYEAIRLGPASQSGITHPGSDLGFTFWGTNEYRGIYVRDFELQSDIMILDAKEGVNLWVAGSVSQPSGDYAEYFESKDGKEIEAGTAVTMDNGKIRSAEKDEIPIGVISAIPGIVGGVHIEWAKKYLRDEFGNHIMEEYQEEIMVPRKEKVKKERQRVEKKKVKETVKRTEVVKVKGKYCQKEITEIVEREVEEPVFEEVDLYDEKGKQVIGKHKVPVMETYEEEIDVLDENGQPVMEGSGEFETKTRAKINPDYDENQEYVPREKRPEWNCVGLLGQLPLRKGQPTAPTWVKIKDITDDVELWLVK